MNKPALDAIISKLEKQKNYSSDVVLMSEYAECDRQRVAVRLHPSDHVGRYHTHEFFEVNYVHSGTCINLIEENYVRMEAGDAVILHPGTFHTLYAVADGRVCNFLIDKDWLLSELTAMRPFAHEAGLFFKEAGSERFYKYVLFQGLSDHAPIRALAERVIGASETDSPWKYLYVEAALLEYLGALAERAPAAGLSVGRGQSESVVIDMLRDIAENCSTVSLDTLSERYFYSKSYISRLFMKSTGKSFHHFLVDMKIGRACAMLDQTSMTVEEIAHALGYEQEYFCRLFKRTRGVTPKEYKKKSGKKE